MGDYQESVTTGQIISIETAGGHKLPTPVSTPTFIKPVGNLAGVEIFGGCTFQLEITWL